MPSSAIRLVTYGTDEKLRKRFTSELKKPYLIIRHIDALKDNLESILADMQFDYVVLLNDKQESEHLDNLKKVVSREKILDYADYICVDKWDARSIRTNMHGKYSGYFFGMSHSQSSLLTPMLDKPLIKLCDGSTDLFFHYKTLQYLAENDKHTFQSAQYFFFEMPYYYFNYDLSMSKKTIKSKINLLGNYNDFHNYGKLENERIRINEYQHFSQMGVSGFKDRKSILKNAYSKSVNSIINRVPRNVAVKKVFISLFRQYVLLSARKHQNPIIEDVASIKPSIWTKLYEKTLEENKLIWGKMVDLINSQNRNAKIVVVVFPFHPIFIQNNQEMIMAMKSIFTESLFCKGRGNIILLDYFEHYATIDNSKHFKDHCHMLPGQTYLDFSAFLNDEFRKYVY